MIARIRMDESAFEGIRIFIESSSKPPRRIVLLPLVSERTPFWNRIALAFLLSFFGGLLFSYYQNPESLKLITHGDFPDYYTAARAILEGQSRYLYNPDLQRAAQEAIWPNPGGGFLYFRYPPFTALLLAPFGAWDPATARILFTLIMSLFLVMSLRVAAYFSPALRASAIQSVALTVAVLPIMIGVLSGQNNALTLLLYSLIVYGFYRSDSKGYRMIGISSGLMLYKPQFGILWTGWLLLTRKKEIIFPMLLVAIIYYWMGVWVLGWDWPIQWLRETSWAISAIQSTDRPCMISINGAASALADRWLISASAHSLIFILAYVFSAILALGIGWRFWIWGDPKVRDQREGFLIACAAGPICLLASPHTMFYDFGLCVIACAPFFNLGSRKHLILILLSFAVIWASMAVRDFLPIQPLFGLTILCAMALIRGQATFKFNGIK